MPKKSKFIYNQEKCMFILKKLHSILDDEYNTESCKMLNRDVIFSLYDLDNNTCKQAFIIGLADTCQKYFATSTWTYFRNIREENIKDRPYLLLLKNILSEFNIKYFTKRTTLTINNQKIATTKYIIQFNK
jgi:hypothetical protein